MKKFEVEYYEKGNGSFPVEEFISSQPKETKAKIFRMLETLEMHGNNLREPYSKLLNDGIFELRIRQKSANVRILYFFIIERKIILTNAFLKKTQKTPKMEILKAKEYRLDYIKRGDNNGQKF